MYLYLSTCARNIIHCGLLLSAVAVVPPVASSRLRISDFFFGRGESPPAPPPTETSGLQLWISGCNCRSVLISVDHDCCPLHLQRPAI